jgi:hypothetical protein
MKPTVEWISVTAGQRCRARFDRGFGRRIFEEDSSFPFVLRHQDETRTLLNLQA